MPAYPVRRAVVVGASFGGLSAAIALKRYRPELDVTVVDARNPPIPHTTGGFGYHWFEKLPWELLIPEEAVAARIRGVRIVSPSGHEAVFRFEGEVGAVLHPDIWAERMLALAGRYGCNLLLGRRVTGLVQEGPVYAGVKVDGDVLRCDVIVAADGANSLIGRMVGRPDIDPMDLHVGFERTVPLPPQGGWDHSLIHLYFGRNVAPLGYLWLFPSHDGGVRTVRLGCGVPRGLNRNPREYLERWVSRHPEFQELWSKPLKEMGGLIPTAPLPKSNVHRNILFVGDAARVCSPLHGGGLGFAVQSGFLAAESIVSGNLGSYDRRLERVLGPLLRRHYLLKQVLYGWGDGELDRMVRAMGEFRMSPRLPIDPNREIMRFVFFLARREPGLIPKMVLTRLRA